MAEFVALSLTNQTLTGGLSRCRLSKLLTRKMVAVGRLDLGRAVAALFLSLNLLAFPWTQMNE